MARRLHFEIDEWYHCFNRGVDKRDLFKNEYDANRFLMLLYVANSNSPVDLYSIRRLKLQDVLNDDRGQPIVSIGAYCVMPNHYHLLLKEIEEGGITSFMRKLGTAYTMYFNSKMERTGHLFSGPFRAKHIANDRYLQKVVEYIHCNPAELSDPRWKSGCVQDIRKLEDGLVGYPYSSLRSFVDKETVNPLLSAQIFDVVYSRPTLRVLEDAQEYYADLAKERFER